LKFGNTRSTGWKYVLCSLGKKKGKKELINLPGNKLNMAAKDQIYNFFDSKEYLRNVAVDNVIFGYHNRELKVLLLRPVGLEKWTLTGGFIKKSESIQEAAVRIAYLRTGLKNLFLQQFHSFGTPKRNRDKAFTPESLGKATGIRMPDDLWIFEYSVSIGFYTLTEFSQVSLNKGPFEDEIQWCTVNQLPTMMFDHKMIIEQALKALRLHIYQYPIGYELLPEKFTLPDIHSLYETVLGKSLDSRNFTRRLMGTGIIKKLDEMRNIGAHRSPFLYKFDKKKYDAALQDGMFLAF
jgi:8-oxo-dGTP diphosphatase